MPILTSWLGGWCGGRLEHDAPSVLIAFIGEHLRRRRILRSTTRGCSNNCCRTPGCAARLTDADLRALTPLLSPTSTRRKTLLLLPGASATEAGKGATEAAAGPLPYETEGRRADLCDL